MSNKSDYDKNVYFIYVVLFVAGLLSFFSGILGIIISIVYSSNLTPLGISLSVGLIADSAILIIAATSENT